MMAYYVDPSLARAVISGQKCSVLKVRGARAHAAVGEVMRIVTAGNWDLMVAPCVVSVPVRIEATRFLRAGEVDTQGCRLELMARGEGYDTFAALRTDYARLHGLPWEGQLLRWNPIGAEFRAQWPLMACVNETEEET